MKRSMKRPVASPIESAPNGWRQLSETQAIAMAAGAGLAAWIEPAVGVVAAAAALTVACMMRRPWIVVCAVIVLAGARSHSEAAAYRPLSSGPFAGTMSLITDPEARTFGWVAEGRMLDGAHEGARVRLTVPWSAGDLGAAVSGSRLDVTGSIRELEASDFFRSRHLRGGVSAAEVSVVAGPRWWRAPSEFIRGRVVAGSAGIPEGLQPLYVGLVIGDDRDQSLGQQARFRVAGMSHLLAVSGQNVAFVLAVLAPVLGRLSPRVRWLLTTAMLVVFAVATRLEPSVIRATVSAGIAVTAVVSGRRSAGVRTLALAVSGLLVVDPFLIRSVGFVLSVGASFGIVMLGPAMAGRIGGPRPIAEAMAITVAAQVAVAPVLIATFGPVSVASVPANVAAGWAAGFVMMWGASVGLLIGLAPPAWQPILSAPVAVVVGWIDAVARFAVRAPLPSVGAVGCLAAIAAVVLLWSVGGLTFRGRLIGRFVQRVGLVIGVGALMLAAEGASAGRAAEVIAGGGTFFGGTPSVLVVDASPTTELPEAVLARRVGRADIVVLTSGDRWSAMVAAAIRDVVGVGTVLAPPGHRVPGAVTVRDDLVVERPTTGGGPVRITVDGDGRLGVTSP